MRSKTTVMAAIAAIVTLLAAGCGSSGHSSSGASNKTITIGVLTDLTGPAASTEISVPEGVKAGVIEARKEGYTIKYDVVDGATSPATTLAAAQRMVFQDHVFAVVAVSALAFTAADFLKSHGVPVVGASVDGTEWATDSNMFAIDGTPVYTQVYRLFGDFFKLEGATNVATLGYGVTQSSNLSTKTTAASIQLAGLKVGYLNANFPFGSTNVGPIAIAIKNAGADGYYGGVETSTNFALIQALRNDGVKLKAALLPIGYGGDLLSGGPGARQAAQGVYFTVAFEPIEMHTAATEKMEANLKAAGVAGDPTANEIFAYVSVLGLLAGLQAEGAHPTQAGFIQTMLHLKSFDAEGLLGSHPVQFGMAYRAGGYGPEECSWITQFQGSSFHLVAGADPICGAIVPGKKVS